MNLDKEKLNDLIHDRRAWAALGTVLVALVGVFGYKFSDNAVALWTALVSGLTGG